MEHHGDESRAGRRTSPVTLRNSMLVMLSLAAGCVDAVGYLGLGQIFVANMTGNTVLLGLALGQAEARAALRAVVALVGFIVGVAVGAAILGPGRERSTWPPGVTAALALELVVLIAFAIGWFFAESEPAGLTVYPLILLPAVAMGLQSAAVRRMGIPGVATTYITGTLTDLTEGAIARLRPAVSATILDGRGEEILDGRREERPEQRRPSARGLLLPADVWLAYGIGAVIVGILTLRWPAGVLSVPVAVLALVVAIAVARFRDQW
jgi:uncharacterized membrane protein YoaK (UPF0700 family)